MAKAAFVSGNPVAIDYTPEAAVAAGDVVRLADGRVAIAFSAIAAGILGAAYDSGLFRIVKAAVALLPGQIAWWDISAAKITHELDGDFPVGIVTADAAAAGTTALVDLNVHRLNDIDLTVETHFTSEATDGLGVVRTRGIETLAFDAVAEVAQAALISRGTILPEGGPILEAIAAIYNIGDDAALDIDIGLASGSHATDFEAVVSFATFHLDGAALDLKVQSDDGTTDVAAVDTTVNLVDDTYVFLQIDARDLADVKFYVNGIRVNAATTFAVKAATALYAIAHMEKTSNDTVADLRVKAMRVYRTIAA